MFKKPVRRFVVFRSLAALLALGALALPVALSAQSPHAHNSGVADGEVAEVRAAVAAMGRRWNAQVMAETARLYTALQRKRDSDGIRSIRDLSYGPDAQQRLDLFVPEQGFEELGSVFVYLHDSDATSHDKIVAGSDGLLYSNVARAMARMGGIGINANYRLEAKPVGSEAARDVRQLVEWMHANLASHGGDPEAIIVVGHGAGALRLASYLFDQQAQAAGGPGIAGAILTGADFDTPAFWKLLDAYRGRQVPILLWSSDLDPVESGVAELKDRLCTRHGACPMFAELKGHNHVSAVMSFDSPDTSAVQTIFRFYHSAVRK